MQILAEDSPGTNGGAISKSFIGTECPLFIQTTNGTINDRPLCGLSI